MELTGRWSVWGCIPTLGAWERSILSLGKAIDGVSTKSNVVAELLEKILDKTDGKDES